MYFADVWPEHHRIESIREDMKRRENRLIGRDTFEQCLANINKYLLTTFHVINKDIKSRILNISLV